MLEIKYLKKLLEKQKYYSTAKGIVRQPIVFSSKHCVEGKTFSCSSKTLYQHGQAASKNAKIEKTSITTCDFTMDKKMETRHFIFNGFDCLSSKRKRLEDNVYLEN